MTSTNVNGLILAGGQSQRMGLDKSSMVYHGKPQLEYLFELLGGFCSRVFTSCKETKTIAARFNPLPDQYAIHSPLNGILTAFSQEPATAWLSVPIDMPFIQADAISFLLKNRDTKKVATCFWDSTGKEPEPLFTIWEPTARALLLEFYQKGKISPRDFLKQADVNRINTPDQTYLTNINTPEEFEQYQQAIRRNVL